MSLVKANKCHVLTDHNFEKDGLTFLNQKSDGVHKGPVKSNKYTANMVAQCIPHSLTPTIFNPL